MQALVTSAQKNQFTTMACAISGDTRERVCLVKLSVCMDVCRVEDKLFTSHKGVRQFLSVGPGRVPVRIGIERAGIHGSFIEYDSLFLPNSMMWSSAFSSLVNSPR